MVIMTMYDMDSEYNGEKLTYASLCQELMDEYEEKTGEIAPSEEYFRDKIKNSKNNGVINKLSSLLGTDIEKLVENAAEPKKEKYNLLKLVKLIYYIEKDGNAKCVSGKDNENVRILITDILRKPRLENIKTEYSEKSVYGDCFESLFLKIKSQVPDAEARIEKIEGINDYWEYITNMVFDYVITDKALDTPKEALQELERIYRFLKVRVLERLTVDNPPVTYENGIFENVFDLLISHRVMCNDRDRLNINYQICEAKEPEVKYVDLFRSREGYVIPRKNIEILEDFICRETENKDIKDIMCLILWGLEEKYYDIEACKFAIKNYETVLNWWIAGKNIDVSESIPIDIFIVIMQELIVVYKDKEGLRNDYVGYNNPRRSLTASVRTPLVADAVAVQAWIKKLENRAVANFGAIELIRKKREIENVIYEIKRYIFSFRNLEDMVFVSSQIYYMASRSMVSQEFAIDIGNTFASNVCKYLSNKIHDINIVLPPEGVNVYNMFKDFSIDKSGALEKVAYELASMTNELYDEEEAITARGLKIFVDIAWSEKGHRQSMLTFWVHRDNNSIEYKQYVGVESDENCSRMRKLGLGKFIVDDNPAINFF